MDTHVKIIGWFYIVMGVLGLIMAALVLLITFGSGLISGDETAILVKTIIATVCGGFLVLVSAPGILAGIGLLKYKSWARILALILAVLNLGNFPLGTILGVYALWVLLNEETTQLFAVETN